MGFHPKSRIMITSSSKAILEDLLPNMELYTPMPISMVEEAGTLFLRRAAPMKALSELTREEQDILGICVQKCWFYSSEGGSYHPVALAALADFFSWLGRAKGNQLLVWKDHLEKEMNLVKDVLKSSKDLFGILGLQFSTFDFSEKLLFLDLALFPGYSRNYWINSGGYHVGWLCRLHDESPTIIGKKGVFQHGGMSLRGDSLTPVKSLSNLIRLRISHMTLTNARLVASKRMQELSNLVLLQLSNCDILTSLHLEGLDCLRHLELFGLSKLLTITLSGNSSKEEYAGIYDSLQHMRLFNLLSLVHMPDLRPCTSLYSIVLKDCDRVVNLEGVDCPCVKALFLDVVYPTHFDRLVALDCLHSLEELCIYAASEVDYFSAQWEQREDESDIGVETTLEGEGPCAKLLEELCLLFCGSNSMVCNSFQTTMGELESYELREFSEWMEKFHSYND